MNHKVIRIDAHNDFRGIQGSFPVDHDIMKTGTPHLSEILKALSEASPSQDPEGRGEVNMELKIKGYLDDRMRSLEKSLNQRIDTQERVLSEKIDHLQTKTEKSINESISSFQEGFRKEKKEDRKFYVTTAIALTAVAVTIIGFLL